MALGRRNRSARREPTFGADSAGRELRINPADRLPQGDARSAAKPRAKRGANSEDAATKSGVARGIKPRGKSAKARRRSLAGRICYWGFVLALWGVIALVGMI